MRKIESKLVERSGLAALVARLSNQGPVVTTNGCFDILHWGHLQYLEKARELGSVLICLVNADASVRKLKGASRPINAEDIRARQLAALECIDYVVIFDEDTPEKILSEIRPAIHCKGGDYRPADLPETKVVEAAGGKVVCLPLAEGFSTTGLLKKIRD